MKAAFEQLWRFARREDLTGLRLIDVLALIVAIAVVMEFAIWLGSGVWVVVLGVPAMFITSVFTTLKIPSYKDDEDE